MAWRIRVALMMELSFRLEGAPAADAALALGAVLYRAR